MMMIIMMMLLITNVKVKLIQKKGLFDDTDLSSNNNPNDKKMTRVCWGHTSR